MASEPGYPQTMVHPQHRAAEIASFESGNGLPGQPERFPPVEVHSADQEAMLRARGYLRYGEQVAKVADYHEFPKTLWHPEHAEAVPDSEDARMENGALMRFKIRGAAEKFPPVVAKDEAEQVAWEEKGYAVAGVSDERAFERATLAPGKPGDEWPKWVDGVLTQDPDAPLDLGQEYPKWLHFDNDQSELVKDPAHEARILQMRGSSKNEPVRKTEPVNKPYVPMPAPAQGADYDEFMAWKAARDADVKAAAEAAAKAEAGEAEERDTLLALARESGIQVDGRWGVRRLREAVLGEAAAD